jgi:hypothetical protein
MELTLTGMAASVIIGGAFTAYIIYFTAFWGDFRGLAEAILFLVPSMLIVGGGVGFVGDFFKSGQWSVIIGAACGWMMGWLAGGFILVVLHTSLNLEPSRAVTIAFFSTGAIAIGIPVGLIPSLIAWILRRDRQSGTPSQFGP